MAADSFLVNSFTTTQWAIGNTTVTCSGTVRAPHGAAIKRKVVVYLDGNPYEVVGVTESSPIDGVFSVDVPGHAAQDFTVVAKGEYGENDEIVANCNLNGTGPTGLYIAQPLNNIQFFVGPGEVSSPFVDILFPGFVVESVAEVDIISWGEVPINMTVDAVVVTPIICWGDVNIPFFQVDAEGSAILDTVGNITIPKLRIDAEATAEIYSCGNVSFPNPLIYGETAAEGEVAFPSFSVEAEAINPIMTDGSVRFKAPVVAAEGVNGLVAFGSVEFPLAEVDGYVLVEETATGQVNFPNPVISGQIITGAIVVGSVVMPSMVIGGEAQSSHAFAPLSFEPDCGLADPVSYGDVIFPTMKIEAVA